MATFGQKNGSSSFTGSIFEPGTVLKCLQTPSWPFRTQLWYHVHSSNETNWSCEASVKMWRSRGNPHNLKMTLFQNITFKYCWNTYFWTSHVKFNHSENFKTWNRIFCQKLDLSLRYRSTNSKSLYNSYKITNFHQLILANCIPFPHARHALLYRSIHILGKNSEKIGGHV